MTVAVAELAVAQTENSLPEQWYQWPNKKDLSHQKLKIRRKVTYPYNKRISIREAASKRLVLY